MYGLNRRGEKMRRKKRAKGGSARKTRRESSSARAAGLNRTRDGSRASAGEWFERLVALQARLRGKDGCPWDREQTHESLRTYLVEETYEVLEALESGDAAKIADELGDLLLQIVFHAQLAQEAGRFDVTQVIERIHTKLVRRHPHVFGNAQAKTAAQVLKNWEQLKKEERGEWNGEAQAEGEGSVLDGVPRTLPAVLEAYQLTRRAAHVGFDWENIEGVLEKMEEEIGELRHSLKGKSRDAEVAETPRPQRRIEEEIGDLLFVAVNVARFLGADPEIALKKANRKFAARFREVERRAAGQGKKLSEMKLEEMEELWQGAKKQEADS